MRFFILVWISLSGTTTVAAEAVQPAGSSPFDAGSESLGEHLLNDLPEAVPRSKPQADRSSGSTRRESSSTAVLQADIAGEDIGGQSGPLLLARVRNGMQQAEALLGRPVAEPTANPLQQAGEVQQRVVAQLDELIAELSKQCQGGQCSPSSNPTPQQSQRSAAKPSSSNRSASATKSPARDSSDPLNRTGSQPVDKGDVDELVKHLWGHLPERSREQVLQSFSDEFLPKYELEIEQYYRRLSEEDNEGSSQ